MKLKGRKRQTAEMGKEGKGQRRSKRPPKAGKELGGEKDGGVREGGTSAQPTLTGKEGGGYAALYRDLGKASALPCSAEDVWGEG